MEIKLKSALFKRIFNSDNISNDYSQQPLRLAIYEDYNVPLIKEKRAYADILEDYSNILANVVNIEMISFNGLPNDLIKEFLKIGFPAKKLMIVNSEFDFSTLDDIEPATFEKIESVHFSGMKSKGGKKTKFRNANALKNLKYLNLYDCETLDLDSFFEEIPNPEEISALDISSNLPDPQKVEGLKGLKSLYIQGVKDSKGLYNFLESISLENLTVLSITDCDLENMPDSVVSRLSSLLALDLNNNSNVNYNRILSALPQKKILKTLAIQDVKDNNFNLDTSQLEKFITLQQLRCRNIFLNFDGFREYIGKDSSLESVELFNTNVQNLEFLTDARTDIYISIEQDDIDFGMLTPEFVKKQSRLDLTRTNTGERLELSYERVQEDDLKRTSGISFIVDDKNLPSIETTLSSVDKIYGGDIRISDNTTLVEEFLDKYSKKIEYGFSLISSSFLEIDQEAVVRLNKDVKIDNIAVIDRECNDAYVRKRFEYTPEQYIELRRKIEEITGDIPQDLSDIQKFMIIYRRLGSRISYDHGIIGANKYSQYAQDNVDDCRNCVNGLMRNTCVCAGYADILYNCLKAVGIEAYKISGLSGEYHQWNKVKIDGVFYNTDLTWDVPSLTKNYIHIPRWCLKGDKFFGKAHKEQIGKKAECPKDLDKGQIIEAFKFAMKFDGIRPQNEFLVVFKDVFQEINKEFQKLFSLKRKKALPEPTIEKSEEKTGSTNVSTFASSPKHALSWDLGERATEVQAKMAEISATTVLRTEVAEKEMDGK